MSHYKVQHLSQYTVLDIQSADKELILCDIASLYNVDVQSADKALST